jgi:hypothetical protein
LKVPEQNVDCGRNFGGLAASNREDPRLVQPAQSPSGFCGIEAGTLRSAHCLIAKLRIGNPKLAHQIKQLASDLIRNRVLLLSKKQEQEQVRGAGTGRRLSFWFSFSFLFSFSF